MGTVVHRVQSAAPPEAESAYPDEKTAIVRQPRREERPAPAPRPSRPARRATSPTPRAGGSAPAVAPRAEPQRQGKLVVFFSSQGGTGTTMLACNMVSALARRHGAACIVDLDLQLGDALAMLDLEPQCPMSRLAREMETFDWEMLETMLARHGSGAHVVSQVGCLEELAELTPVRVPLLLQRLRQRFDFVIVDGLRDFSDHALAVLDVAERIVLVVSQDVPSVRGAARRLHIFRRLGYPPSKIQVVVNRYSKDHPVSLRAISECLGVTPAFLIPKDAAASRSVNEGLTLHQIAPDSALCQEVERMTQELCELQPTAAPTGGFWSRLWRKRGKRSERSKK